MENKTLSQVSTQESLNPMQRIEQWKAQELALKEKDIPKKQKRNMKKKLKKKIKKVMERIGGESINEDDEEDKERNNNDDNMDLNNMNISIDIPNQSKPKKSIEKDE